MTNKPDANISGGMRKALDAEEKYLIEHFTADCGIMRCDIEGSFHRLREASAPVAERGEPVACWIESEVLDELRKHKDASGSVSSGLLKKPFGNPVALYASPSADADAVRRVSEAILKCPSFSDFNTAPKRVADELAEVVIRALASPRPAVGEEK